MIALIVDSSVAIKWFIFEVQSEEARRWRDVSLDLHTFSVFFELEIANVLWKKIRRDSFPATEAMAIFSAIPLLPVIRHEERPLLDKALDLAIQTQRTVYDCLYLALAITLSGRLLTADERLFNSLHDTEWAHYLAWVGDTPDSVGIP